MKSSFFTLIRIISNFFLVLLYVALNLAMALMWGLILCSLFFIPAGSIRIKVKKRCLFFYEFWSFLNRVLLRFNTQVVISGDFHSLEKKNHYIVISNHQAFTDILVNCCLQAKVPFFSYVMKKSLLWQYPIMSWFCYVYGFPFLDRKDRQKDTKKLKKSYRILKTLGNSLVIYPESTRFTLQKHLKSDVPYDYLLKPRIAALAISLGVLQDYLDGLVNITIVYSGEGPSLLSLLSGKISKVNIHVELVDLDNSFFGDYFNPEFKKDFSEKINALWNDKDNLINQIKKSKV